MSETREYKVVTARVRGTDQVTTYLIDAEDAKTCPDIADYFPPGTRDAQQLGTIQVMGDTHLLGLMYDESL